MKLKTLFLIFLTCLKSLAQTDTSKISFVAYWSVGDTMDFKITKVKKQWKNDELIKNDSTQYTARFEVIDSTDKSYKIKWTCKSTLYSDFKLPEQVAEKMSRYEINEIIYQTDELGAFRGIDNWEEIARMTEELFRLYIDYYSETQKIDKAKLAETMAPMMEAYKNKQSIESVIFKELALIHSPLGGEFGAKDTLRYEAELPTIFSDQPCKADAILYFEKVDFKDYYCELIQEQTLNPEDMVMILTNLFQKMGVKESDLKAEMAKAKIEINDYSRWDFYYDPGIPIWVGTQRNVLFEIEKEKSEVQERTIIELLE